MEEIQFSVMVHSPQTEDLLRQLLAEFEAQHRIHVRLWLLDWGSARTELNRVAMYQQGPDISEIGTTWIADQVGMNALRPFSPSELFSLGGEEAFAPACWSTVRLTNQTAAWAIPWLAETYAIHYRKDLLQKAGIDEATAFLDHTTLSQTAAALASSGVDVPAELPLSSDRYGTLHSLASWVWRHGGDFITPEGRKVLFDQPPALEAMTGYFSLLRQLSPAGRIMLAAKGPDDLFRQGKAAISFGTLNLMLARSEMPAEVKNNWGVAPLPAPCFVGGSGLVIWKHTMRDRAAFQLARYLTTAPIQSALSQALAAMPARLESLNSPEISANPATRSMAQALTGGRGYSTAGLWGLVEEHLIYELQQIANELLADPDADVTQAIQKRILPAAKRLNISLGQRM